MLSPAISVCVGDKKVQEKIKSDKKSPVLSAAEQPRRMFLIKFCFLGHFIDKSKALGYNLSVINYRVVQQ